MKWRTKRRRSPHGQHSALVLCAGGGQQDVVQLHVAVDHVVQLEVGQRAHQLPEVIRAVWVLRERVAPQCEVIRAVLLEDSPCRRNRHSEREGGRADGNVAMGGRDGMVGGWSREELARPAEQSEHVLVYSYSRDYP